jgi:hypothetical protein
MPLRTEGLSAKEKQMVVDTGSCELLSVQFPC